MTQIVPQPDLEAISPQPFTRAEISQGLEACGWVTRWVSHPFPPRSYCFDEKISFRPTSAILPPEGEIEAWNYLIAWPKDAPYSAKLIHSFGIYSLPVLRVFNEFDMPSICLAVFPSVPGSRRNWGLIQYLRNSPLWGRFAGDWNNFAVQSNMELKPMPPRQPLSPSIEPPEAVIEITRSYADSKRSDPVAMKPWDLQELELILGGTMPAAYRHYLIWGGGDAMHLGPQWQGSAWDLPHLNWLESTQIPNFTELRQPLCIFRDPEGNTGWIDLASTQPDPEILLGSPTISHLRAGWPSFTAFLGTSFEERVQRVRNLP